MSESAGAAQNTERNKELVKDLLAKFETMKERREAYEPEWKEITDFILPRRSSWDLEEEPEKKTRVKLFNTYALYALQLLSRSFVGYMVSRTEQYFSLKVEQLKMAIPGVADWLEQIQQLITAELSSSNFYESLSELVPDCGATGTATLYNEENIGKKKIFFSARHPKEIWVEEDNFGVVDTVYRKFRITYKQAKQSFGDGLHPTVLEEAKLKPYKYVIMLHIVTPRGDRMQNSPLSKDMPWASYYIDIKNNHLVSEKGYQEMPYFVWRWIKNSDEVYGVGPGMDALTDVKMLNQVARTRLNLAQLTSDPPWAIDDGMKGDERILPHGMNYVGPNQEPPQALQVGANYPINKDVEASLQKTIGWHFNVDFFLMVSQQDKNMTAREVIERKGEGAAVLGGVVGRFEQEILSPVIERTYKILNRRGVLPPPPPELLEAGGKIEIVYSGFLEQIRKKYFQTTGISQALEFFMPISQVSPEILDNIDMDELTRNAMNGYGLAQSIIREQPDVNKIRQNRAQVQQQQQAEAIQLEQQKLIAQNSDKLNQKVVTGSPLEAIANK
jgi:hypothetical protein